MEPLTGNQVGRYQLISELGRGGMAVVYVAHDPLMDRRVAVKVMLKELTADRGFAARFQREAQVVARLEHRAIVPTYDYGLHNGQPYLVMRYMTGGSLKERLTHGAMTPAAATHILAQIGPALDYAHGLGIVHRDIKPDNILFDDFGDAYLSDFGIVKIASSSTAALTVTGGILGTPAYMSPEQARGLTELDGRSDIYSLGIVLFEMLSGEKPYKADTPMGLAMMHVLEPVPRILQWRSDLSQAVDNVLTEALAKDRVQRYGSATQFASAFRLAAAGEMTEKDDIPDTEVKPPAFAENRPTLSPTGPKTEPSTVISSEPSGADELPRTEVQRPDFAAKEALPWTAHAPDRPLKPPEKARSKAPRFNRKDLSLSGFPWLAIAGLALIGLMLISGVVIGALLLFGGDGSPVADEEYVITRPPIRVSATPSPTPEQLVGETSEEGGTSVAEELATEPARVLPAGSADRPIRLLFATSADDTSALAGGQRLISFLEEQTGLNFELQLNGSVRKTVEALCESPGETAAFIDAMAFVVANERCGAQPGLVAIRFGYSWFAGQFVVRNDSGLRSLEDFDGRSWCIPGEYSPSGYIYPLARLLELGVEVNRVIETGDHTESMMGVYSGRCDFGTAYFSPPLLPFFEQEWRYGQDPEIWRAAGQEPAGRDGGQVYVAGGPSEGGYRILDARSAAIDRAPDVFAQTRILALTPPIPNNGLAFGEAVPSEIFDSMLGAIEAFVITDGCQQSICSGELLGWSGAERAPQSSYDPVRIAIEVLGYTEEDILGQ